MSVIGSNVLAGASGQAAGYEIERSLRFNSADSAYLSRTPSSAGNRTTWSLAMWVKRSAITTGGAAGLMSLFGWQSGGSGQSGVIGYDASTDKLSFGQVASTYRLTNAVFRDVAAWAHLLFVWDSNNSTDSQRCRIYVNGSEASYSSAPSISSGTQLDVNTTVAHGIGADIVTGSGSARDFFSGYLADIHFIDGQALAPTDFGEYDDNNVWQPIEYTFGTNPNNGTTWNSTYAAAFLGNAMTDSALVGSYSGLNSSITITLSSSVQVISSLKLNLYASVANFSTYTTISINGTDETANMTLVQSTGTNSGVWEVTGFTGTLSSITLGAQNGANNGISRVIVDGFTLLNGADDNSFHLDFSDNSTAAALGTDTSGNSNTWTVMRRSTLC